MRPGVPQSNQPSTVVANRMIRPMKQGLSDPGPCSDPEGLAPAFHYIRQTQNLLHLLYFWNMLNTD